PVNHPPKVSFPDFPRKITRRYDDKPGRHTAQSIPCGTQIRKRGIEMKRTVLIFGVISGLVSAVTMLATLPFMHKISSDKALIIGYTTIVLAGLLVFFGIRSYRDNVSGGKLTFARGLAVGILISLLSNCLYVATWEIVSYKFM